MNEKDRGDYDYNDWVEEINSIEDPRERQAFQIRWADEIQAAEERDRESEEQKRKIRHEELRRRKTRTQREVAQQLAEERMEAMRDQPNAIPAEWVIDGSWGLLAPAEKAVCVVLYSLLPPTGKWKWLPRYQIGDLACYTEETVSRTTSSLAREGWILKRTHWDKEQLKKRVFYRLPPEGPRKVRT